MCSQRGLPVRLRCGGFTLIELIVVMGLISVLLGMGVGFLQRKGNDVEVALAMVRDQVRMAGLTARTKRLPATVILDVGDRPGPASVQARVLFPVGQWQMEERERGDDRLIPDVLGGTTEPGRFGLARRPDGEDAILELDTSSIVETLFDLREGFALHLDVFLEERGSRMTLASLGPNLILEVDENLVPEVKVVRRDGDRAGGSRAGGSIELRAAFPLRLKRWVTVSVAHDREIVSLMVDGRRAASAEMTTSLYQQGNEKFVVSPAHASVLGLVDEVRVLAYEVTEKQVFPSGVELEIPADASRVRFGRDGRLARPIPFVIQFGTERHDYVIDPEGIVQ